DNGNDRRRGLRCADRGSACGCDDDGHTLADQIGGQARKSIVPAVGIAVFDRNVPAFDQAGFAQPFAECGEEGCELSGGGAVEISYHRHRRLLRARRERPSGSTAEQRDELAPPHLITSSATPSPRRSRASKPRYLTSVLISSRYAIANRPFAPHRSPCWQPNDRARRRPRCRSDSECRPRCATRWLLGRAPQLWP